jgi:siroheme synthase-like protein
MAYFPLFVKLESRRVVVIGTGLYAGQIIMALNKSGARVVVVAEFVNKTFQELCSKPGIELIISPYESNYVSEALFVVNSSHDLKINSVVYNDCQKAGVLCHTVSDPALSDFSLPETLRRGDLQIAVCTDNKCRAYERHIVKKLERFFEERHGEFLEHLHEAQKRLILDVPNPVDRKAIVGYLSAEASFEYFKACGSDRWYQRAKELFGQKFLRSNDED